MFRKLLEKIKNKFIPEKCKEKLYDYTWLESLEEILFFVGENREDFIVYTDMNELEKDIVYPINFIAYSNNFIYYAHYNNTDTGDSMNTFKVIPLSEYGYEFLEGNTKHTIH